MPAVDIFPFLHAIDELSREKRDVEEAIKQGFLQIKLAAKFLMSDNNRDAQERDPEFMQQQKEALQEALKKLVDEERATTRLTTALSEMRNDAGQVPPVVVMLGIAHLNVLSCQHDAGLHDQLKNAAAVDGDLPDFNAVLKAKLESSGKSAASAYDKHPRYREMMELFQEQMDEDDELHVMPTQASHCSRRRHLTMWVRADSSADAFDWWLLCWTSGGP